MYCTKISKKVEYAQANDIFFDFSEKTDFPGAVILPTWKQEMPNATLPMEE